MAALLSPAPWSSLLACSTLFPGRLLACTWTYTLMWHSRKAILISNHLAVWEKNTKIDFMQSATVVIIHLTWLKRLLKREHSNSCKQIQGPELINMQCHYWPFSLSNPSPTSIGHESKCVNVLFKLNLRREHGIVRCVAFGILSPVTWHFSCIDRT